MLLSRVLKIRYLTVVLLVLIVAASAYAFAAANNVPATGAGDGKTAISGYDVTVVKYNLNSSDPTKIATVSFTLTPLIVGAPAPNVVKIKLVATGTDWYSCAVASGTWTCDVADATVLSVTELRVVAVTVTP